MESKEFFIKVLQELEINDEEINIRSGFKLENETDDMFDLFIFCIHITKSLADNNLEITKRFPFKTDFIKNILFDEHLNNMYSEMVSNKLEMLKNYKDLTNE